MRIAALGRFATCSTLHPHPPNIDDLSSSHLIRSATIMSPHLISSGARQGLKILPANSLPNVSRLSDWEDDTDDDLHVIHGRIRLARLVPARDVHRPSSRRPPFGPSPHSQRMTLSVRKMGWTIVDSSRQLASPLVCAHGP